MLVKIKCSSGDTHTAELESSMTVLQVKEKLVDIVNVPVVQQRLIYKGRVLKDNDLLETYGVQPDHTIHFVKGAAPRTTTTTTSTSTPGATTTTTTPTSAFGMGPNAQQFQQMQQQMLQNPELMSQMMNSPMVQSVLSNPDIIRNTLMNNPAMRQVLETNPQLNHLLNDPELLRQTMEAVRNPESMREMMRNQDTALRNVESHPEGFNALRRMYQDVQEPLMSAAQGANAPPVSSFPMPGAAGGSSNTTNTSSNPTNPWAQGAPTNSTTPANTNPTNPWAMGMAGSNPMGMNSNDPQQLLNALQNNPAMSSMMQSMMSNPQVMEAAIQSNPQLRAMMDANPQMRAMFQNPEFMRQIMNPQNMQAVLQMQQSMNQLSQAGLMPGMNPTNPNPAADGTSSSTGPNYADLLSNLNLGGATGSGEPRPPPEELYASQITQLNDMGFTNREQNIRALTQTMGNVNAAVERILSGLS